jgi:predicted lipoprotein with Yx(FWY)xxD motif
MRKSALNRSIFFLLLPALAAGILLTSSLAGARISSGTKTVVKEGGNPAADNGFLTNLKGRTLYTLSNERSRFVCKGACLQSWPPLVIGTDLKPTGAAKLGTRARPDREIQVTYKGRPLYTYAGDTKKGDTNGEGLKTGGGTWHVAGTPQVAQQPPSPPNPYPAPNPYGY